MRLVTLVLSAMVFLIVAGLTVTLQVRKSIREYQLAREQEEWESLRHEIHRATVRMHGQCSPPQVYRIAMDHRRARQGEEIPGL